MKILMRCSVPLAIGSALLAIVALSGCQKAEENADKGPAEIAGKQIDKAAVVVGENLKQAAEETGKVIENAGAKLQEKAKEAQH